MSKAMKKRILSIAMVIGIIWTGTAGLCFAGQASVPTTIAIGFRLEDGVDFYITEKIVLQRIEEENTAVEVTPLEIQNWSTTKTLQMNQMQVVPQDNWALMEKADFDAADAAAKKLYLYIPESTGDTVLTYDAGDPTKGVYAPTDFTIAAKGSRSITMQGEAGLYEKNFTGGRLIDEPVARAIVTLSVKS
jgi:hypothetical protein